MKGLGFLCLLFNFKVLALERVISTSPALTEMISFVAGEDVFVGVSQYCQYPQKVCQKPSVGTSFELDYEKILSLRPDAVFFQSLNDDRTQTNLKKLNVKVYKYSLVRLDDIFKTLSHLGDIFQKKEKAQRKANEIKKSLKAKLEMQDVLLSVGATLKDQKITNLTVVGKENYMGDILDSLSLKNKASFIKGYKNIHLEKLIKLEPKLILFVLPKDLRSSYEKGLKELQKKGFLKNTKFKFLIGQNYLIPSQRILSLIEDLKRELRHD